MTFADIIEGLTDLTQSTGAAVRRGARKVSRLDREDLLAALGLEPKRTVAEKAIPAAGYVALGLLAGIGLGLLFAPRPGYELRETLNEQLKTAMKKGEGVVEEAVGRS